ncbi:MAG: DUF3467 domain-containing protein [Chloroflexota bacterium]
MTTPNRPPAGIPMELPDDLAPFYSNVVRISHTPTDFVLDFVQVLPAQLRNLIRSRIVMSPVGAKLFLRAFAENLARYEASFGEIQIPQGDPGLAGDLFRRIHPTDPNPPPQGE